MASYGPPPVVPGPSILQCVVKVQLNISCRNLLDKDVMSKSDPMTVVSMFNTKSSSWFEVSQARDNFWCMRLIERESFNIMTYVRRTSPAPR